MGDENPIRTLGDYSKPSHEGYMNTIELPVGNNVAPLRSDTIRALPRDTVKNPKLKTSPVLSARSYLTKDSQCSTHVHGSINAITIHPEQQSDSYDDKENENKEEEKDNPENIHVIHSTPLDPSISLITEKVLKFNSFFESLGLVPQSSDTDVVCTKGHDGEVMFIELIRKNDDSSEGEKRKGVQQPKG
ncbi:hypothetical protein Tco_0748231 [Tanacetum coccineum]|uniref:Uncharacterized protein n=1 Tax=Tanacetum coccineum TaxID=301880 RepID=A0ABQ4YV77_9ASTR